MYRSKGEMTRKEPLLYIIFQLFLSTLYTDLTCKNWIKYMSFKRCQSCGVPLANNQILGTQEDGAKNNEYCIFCFKEGNFTEPNITMEAIINKCTNILASKSEIPKENIQKIMQVIIPQLKRWKH